MQQRVPVRGSTRFCWICGRAISHENCKADEHENIVHEACYEGRVKLNDFRAWKQRCREDCVRHQKLSAFDAIGDYLLRVIWESGVNPTVEAVVDGVRKEKAG